MAISVAPLTTTVMSSVDEAHVGVASGVNNAVSRVAGLLAIAVLGLALSSVFSKSLDHQMNSMNLSPETRNELTTQKSKLAGAQTNDPQAHQAIQQSFLAGYRTIIWISVMFALASSMTASLLIKSAKAESKPAANS